VHERLREDMSDYVDENFEQDETEEQWGVTSQFVRNFNAHKNHFLEVDKRAKRFNNMPGIRQGYVYKTVR